MLPGRAPPDLDLVWLDALTDDLDTLADRIGKLAAEARGARRRGVDRTSRFKIMSTASLVAEWLSYDSTDEAPEALLAELWRRARSHEPDSGPGLALLRRALEHQVRRVPPRQSR